MSGIFCSREEVLGPLGADVFIGLSEEEQDRRHIADVEAPSDKDVNISVQIDRTFQIQDAIKTNHHGRLRIPLESKDARM